MPFFSQQLQWTLFKFPGFYLLLDSNLWVCSEKQSHVPNWKEKPCSQSLGTGMCETMGKVNSTLWGRNFTWALISFLRPTRKDVRTWPNFGFFTGKLRQPVGKARSSRGKCAEVGSITATPGAQGRKLAHQVVFFCCAKQEQLGRTGCCNVGKRKQMELCSPMARQCCTQLGDVIEAVGCPRIRAGQLRSPGWISEWELASVETLCGIAMGIWNKAILTAFVGLLLGKHFKNNHILQTDSFLSFFFPLFFSPFLRPLINCAGRPWFLSH